MDWVLDHLRLLFLAAGAVAWMMQQRKQAKPAEKSQPAGGKTFADPELAERTRKIREEIQRKIEERTRRATPARPAVPPAATQSPPMAAKRVVTPRATVPKPAKREEPVAPPAPPEPVLAAIVTPVVVFESHAAQAEAAAVAARLAVLEDLRDPAALRRAFVLREVIGPPIALRN